MSPAALAIRDAVAPLLPGYAMQYGRWEDDHGPATRFAVLKPAGGGQAELVRRPQFTLSLVGLSMEDRSVTSADADALIEGLRSTAGRLVFIQPAEPVFMATDDGRPVFEIALSAITN